MGLWIRTASHRHPQGFPRNVSGATCQRQRTHRIRYQERENSFTEARAALLPTTAMLIKKRATAFAQAEVLLLTPKTTLDEANRLLGADPLYTATQVATYRAARKTAIEPVFDLLSKLLSVTGIHKPLPMRGLAYVSTFLGLGILLLQLSMLINVRCGIPTRNVSHIKTCFR